MAWFTGKCDTDTLAVLLSFFAKWYDDAHVAVENNNHGHAVVQSLKPIWPSLMYEIDYTKNIDYEKVKMGWNTNMVTRPIMCADLRTAIKQNVDGIQDPHFFQEAMTFVLNERGRPEAAAMNLDDRVFAQAIKFQLHKWLPSPTKVVRRPQEYYKQKDYQAESKRRSKRARQPKDTY